MAQLLKTIPAFPVHKMDTAVEFYQTKFGFSCRYKATGFAILVRDNIELHLWASNDKRWKLRSLLLFLRPVTSGAESFLAGTHSCRIEVEGVDQLYHEFKQTKVLYNENTTVTTTGYGTREFPALDLHGNLLTFYERKK